MLNQYDLAANTGARGGHSSAEHGDTTAAAAAVHLRLVILNSPIQRNPEKFVQS